MEDMFFQLTNGAPAPYITPKKFVKKSKQTDAFKTPTTAQTPRVSHLLMTISPMPDHKDIRHDWLGRIYGYHVHHPTANQSQEKTGSDSIRSSQCRGEVVIEEDADGGRACSSSCCKI